MAILTIVRWYLIVVLICISLTVMLGIFSCDFWPSVCLLWRNMYFDLPIFWSGCFVLFFLMSSCMSYLCVLEISPLLVSSFANIFSHSVGCLFILSMAFFAVQKLLSLTWFHLFIFVFIFIFLDGGFKKILLQFMSKSILPMFPSKNCVASSLTFRSLTHFEFILVYHVRECSNFTLLHVVVQFSQNHLLKRQSSLHCIFLPLCHSGISILFHWSMFVFVLVQFF